MGNWFSNIFNPSATNEQWLSSTTGILHDQFYDPSNPEQPGYNGSGPKSSIPGTLHAIHDHIATANDTYRKTAQDLDNPHTYQGGGANAFFAAVDADVNHSLPVMDSFQHAAGAAAILGSSITASSQKYDSRIAGISAPAISSPFADLIGIFAPSTTVPSNLYYKWRDRLISTFFGNMINMAASNHSDLLSEFLQYGSGTMDGPWTAAVNTVQGIVTTDADQYASSQFDPAVAEREAAQLLNDLNPFLSSSTKANSDKVTQQNVEQIESQFHQQVQQAFTKAFDNLAQDLHGHITGWAGELQASYSTFQTSMKNVDVLTARDLFQFIHGMNAWCELTTKPTDRQRPSDRAGERSEASNKNCASQLWPPAEPESQKGNEVALLPGERRCAKRCRHFQLPGATHSTSAASHLTTRTRRVDDAEE
jgi:hypothetical protein